MSKRFFSTTARALIKWIGYDKEKLPGPIGQSLANAAKAGGKIEKVVGNLKKIKIMSRDGNPVHQSSFNPADKEWVIRVKAWGSWCSNTFHVYEDGRVTGKMGELESGDQGGSGEQGESGEKGE